MTAEIDHTRIFPASKYLSSCHSAPRSIRESTRTVGAILHSPQMWITDLASGKCNRAFSSQRGDSYSPRVRTRNRVRARRGENKICISLRPRTVVDDPRKSIYHPSRRPELPPSSSPATRLALPLSSFLFPHDFANPAPSYLANQPANFNRRDPSNGNFGARFGSGVSCSSSSNSRGHLQVPAPMPGRRDTR